MSHLLPNLEKSEACFTLCGLVLWPRLSAVILSMSGFLKYHGTKVLCMCFFSEPRLLRFADCGVVELGIQFISSLSKH